MRKLDYMIIRQMVLVLAITAIMWGYSEKFANETGKLKLPLFVIGYTIMIVASLIPIFKKWFKE